MPGGLTFKLRGGIYYAIGSVGRRRIRKSLGTRDELRAQELCALYEAKLWKRHSYGEEAVRTFEEAALSYQQAEGEGRFLAPLIKCFRGRVLGTIKAGEIVDAAYALYPAAKPATRNRQAIVPMRAVLAHASVKGWCAPIKVKNFPVQKVRRTAVDRSWIDAFLSQSDADNLPHLSAALLFMFQTGTRISEAARVLPEHVNLGEKIILLEDTKTGKWQRRDITEELAVRIANLPPQRSPRLFGYASRFGIRARAKAVCRRAKIPFVPSHQAGRHSFATNALAMGADPKQVMEAGGWKSARLVLEIYAHAENAGRIVAGLFEQNRSQPTAKMRQVIGREGKK